VVASPSATFTFTASKSGATFQCRLDGAAWAACTSPRALAGLADGVHTFHVRACKSGACDATPATQTWTVDLVAPDTIITGGPSGATSSGSATFTFTATEAAMFQCQLDGASWTPCTSPRMLSPLPDGNHVFAVRACDVVGNCDPTPATRAWLIDRTPPDAIITSGPPPVATTTTATFTFVASEPGATFQCALDGGAFAPCASPRPYAGLAQGTHAFALRACDLVGNCDVSPAMWTWTIDVIAPTTTITSGPSGQVATRDATFTFVASEPGASFTCRLDFAAYVPCISPWMVSALADGPHSITVRACDPVGNCDGAGAVRNWIVAP
jgi:hypothetical protein